MTATGGRGRRIAFDRVNAAALRNAEAVLSGLLPAGNRVGHEWIALNPRRADRRAGSFKANLTTGRWGDFASGDAGGDLVSLAAFVANCTQREAAIRLAERLGVDPYEAAP